MRKALEILIAETKRLNSLYPMLDAFYSEAMQEPNTAELADIAYVLSKCADSIDKVRKKIAAIGGDCEQWTALRMTAEETKLVRGELCSASVKSKTWYRVPTKRRDDPLRYDSIMASLGVPLSVAQAECVRFHGPGLADYLSTAPELPNGIESKDLTQVELSLRFTTTKGLDL